MRIPQGAELAAQALVAGSVFVVFGMVLLAAFEVGSPSGTVAAVTSILGLVFLIGLRMGGKAPGD
jgi:hypothetical protein